MLTQTAFYNPAQVINRYKAYVGGNAFCTEKLLPLEQTAAC